MSLTFCFAFLGHSENVATADSKNKPHAALLLRLIVFKYNLSEIIFSLKMGTRFGWLFCLDGFNAGIASIVSPKACFHI